MIPTGLIKKKALRDKKYLVLNSEEQESLKFYLDRATEVKNQRAQTLKEFDDLTYEEDYELNTRAMNTYLRPKKNDDEVRIATGTTEKKVESVLIELLAMNYQPDIQAFDKDDRESIDLGADMEDLVKRTNEIEHDDDFRVEAYQELVCQRALFVEELYTDRTVDDKRVSKQGMRGKPSKYKDGKYKICRAEKRVLSGLQVFLGDITIPAYLFDTQPFIIKYDRVSFSMAEQMYGEFENWQYVKPGMPGTDIYGLTFKYRFGSLAKEEVEIITYMSYPDDEYQVIINGVMMYEPGEPLPWEHEGYNIKMVVLKPMGRTIAYGKCLIASAKTLQALENETIRLLVRKFRQAIEPPMGSSSNRVFSKDIWSPGKVTQGVGKDDFSKLIDHDGVNKGEMAMYQLIAQKADEFIGRSELSAGIGQKKLTAAQTIEIQKQAAKMLGFAVLAVIRLHRDCTYLRIANIIENYADPIGKKFDPQTKKIQNIYRSFSIRNASVENDKRGNKQISFSDAKRSFEDQQMMETSIRKYEQEQEDMGKLYRFREINVEKLRSVPAMWYVTINQAEHDGSPLNKVIFDDQIKQAVQISQIAQRPINGDKVVEQFERTWKAKEWFQQPAPQQLGGQGGVQQQAQQLLQQIQGGPEAQGGGLKQGITQGAMAGASAGVASMARQ